MYHKAYIQFLIHFHSDYDYFECHEVLEEHWKIKPRGEREQHWVGLIQIAVALYHHRRSNWNGAERMMRSALFILQNEKQHIEALGLEYSKLLLLLEERLYIIQNHDSYTTLFLPFADLNLEHQCIQLCKTEGLPWKETSSTPSEDIIHKHSRRNREDVINERDIQLQKRKQR
ncbi:hypothetical protein SAMN04488168_10182 [Bacillus sp. 491mf]|uniref:DUF309 domain-containing protein n=1 Tax=Bacillus TaxID=1386 RepID=UPI0005570A51|nr:MULTISPECIES: DUF309 domain-containing protein [unclassified Bacillus (in: firmicutes)]SFB90597.1 hypothetical protein SAMN04488168_10182 [Bacillus sp. 491mf]